MADVQIDMGFLVDFLVDLLHTPSPTGSTEAAITRRRRVSSRPTLASTAANSAGMVAEIRL